MKPNNFKFSMDQMNDNPTQVYLNQLQQEAKAVTKNMDATMGEKIIREGLQKWPQLVDQELGKFKDWLCQQKF